MDPSNSTGHTLVAFQSRAYLGKACQLQLWEHLVLKCVYHHKMPLAFSMLLPISCSRVLQLPTSELLELQYLTYQIWILGSFPVLKPGSILYGCLAEIASIYNPGYMQTKDTISASCAVRAFNMSSSFLGGVICRQCANLTLLQVSLMRARQMVQQLRALGRQHPGAAM